MGDYGIPGYLVVSGAILKTSPKIYERSIQCNLLYFIKDCGSCTVPLIYKVVGHHYRLNVGLKVWVL